MSTLHEHDIEEQYVKNKRLIKAAQLHLGDPPDPELRFEQSQVAKKILETSSWMREALSKVNRALPKATSKQQITLMYHLLDKIIYTWVSANDILEAFGLADVEGPENG